MWRVWRSVDARLVAIYTIAAGYAGIAGALLAQTTAFASLEMFSFDRSADLMLMLVIGGTGWLWGGIAGAIVFKLMHNVISSITPQYWTFWIGLFLVVLVMVGRDRLLRLSHVRIAASDLDPLLPLDDLWAGLVFPLRLPPQPPGKGRQGARSEVTRPQASEVHLLAGWRSLRLGGNAAVGPLSPA